MNTKRFILFFFLIALLWSLDYGLMGANVRESVRFIGHVIAFVAVLICGYIFWRKIFHWAAAIWIAAYSLILLALLSAGISYKLGYLQNQNLLLDASNIRLLFTTPAPFIAFYLIIKWGNKVKDQSLNNE